MRIVIPVYSEQELSPRAAEVLRAVTDEAYPEHNISYCEWSDLDRQVLVFGKAPENHGGSGIQWVYTYSIAQMMTKANAASVIKAALRQFIEEPEKIPFREPLPVGVKYVREHLDTTRPVVIDIETSGNLGKVDTPEDIGIISVGFYQPGQPPLVVVGEWNEEEGHTEDLAGYDVRDLFDLLPKFEKVIYHNGKFDIRVMNRVFGVNLVNWFDTMLAHHVLNIAAGDHKLKSLARRYLGAPEWEVDLSRYTKGGGHYELIPTGFLVQYNGWDVYWTYKLWEFLAPQIEADEAAERALTLEMAAADFLLDVEKYGIPMDLDYARDYDRQLETDAVEALAELRYRTGKGEFNPGSPKQVKEWLVARGYGVESTDEEHIAEIRSEANEFEDSSTYLFCDDLLKYRKLRKIQGTYVKGWSSKARNGRVHPTFLVHGTSTGRLSSTSPNSQNVPRDKMIRKLVRTLGDEA